MQQQQVEQELEQEEEQEEEQSMEMSVQLNLRNQEDFEQRQSRTPQEDFDYSYISGRRRGEVSQTPGGHRDVTGAAPGRHRDLHRAPHRDVTGKTDVVTGPLTGV